MTDYKRERQRLEIMASTFKDMAEQTDTRDKFGKRGLSERTVKALADCSIDYPERLLFMTNDQIRSIPGVGKVGVSEIQSYRALFIVGPGE